MNDLNIIRKGRYFGFVDAGEHDIGDITLFRYNSPHAVTEVDPTDELDWNSEKGRWTMILPYY